jgi:hypothetical protein
MLTHLDFVSIRLRRPFIRRGTPPGEANGLDGGKDDGAGPTQLPPTKH